MCCPRCQVGNVGVAFTSVKCRECGEKGHMPKDCEAALCYFCSDVGHQKVACHMVNRKKVQYCSASDSSSPTTLNREVTARSATAASSTSMTTNDGSRGVHCNVIRTSFARVASTAPSVSLAKEDTLRLLGQSKKSGAFPSPNFDDKLVELRR